MQRTIAETIDQRQKSEITSFVATVVAVDYLLPQLAVNIRGNSGPRRVKMAKSISAGTAADPKIVKGSQILVQRINDEYICIAVIG